jgi:hypothetical protein
MEPASRPPPGTAITSTFIAPFHDYTTTKLRLSVVCVGGSRPPDCLDDPVALAHAADAEVIEPSCTSAAIFAVCVGRSDLQSPLGMACGMGMQMVFVSP